MFRPQVVALVVALSAVSLAVAQVGGPARPLPPEVVATVNGRPIRAEEVTRKLLQWYGRAGLQVLMVDAVLADAARQAGVLVTDEEVAVRQARAEERGGGRAEFRRRLVAQGVTVGQFRQDLRRELLIERLLESQGRLTVAEKGLRDMYRRLYGERLELAMILVAKEAEAREIESLLVEGADFGRLARERSQDRVSGPASGRLGQVVHGDLLPELQEAVFALRPGEVSRPLLTQYGYHIFKMLERLPAEDVPLGEVREEVAQAAREQKLAAERSALIAELLRQADIAVNETHHPWASPPEAAWPE